MGTRIFYAMTALLFPAILGGMAMLYLIESQWATDPSLSGFLDRVDAENSTALLHIAAFVTLGHAAVLALPISLGSAITFLMMIGKNLRVVNENLTVTGLGFIVMYAAGFMAFSWVGIHGAESGFDEFVAAMGFVLATVFFFGGIRPALMSLVSCGAAIRRA